MDYGFNKELQKAIEECCDKVGDCFIQKKKLKFNNTSLKITSSRARVWNLYHYEECKGAWLTIKMTCGNDYCLNIDHMKLRNKEEISIEKARIAKRDREERAEQKAKKISDRNERRSRGFDICNECRKEIYCGTVTDRDGHIGFCSFECALSYRSKCISIFIDSEYKWPKYPISVPNSVLYDCKEELSSNDDSLWYILGIAEPFTFKNIVANIAGFKSYEECICKYGNIDCFNENHLIEKNTFINCYMELDPKQATTFRLEYIETLRKELIKLSFGDNQDRINEIIKLINIAEEVNHKEINEEVYEDLNETEEQEDNF